MNVNNSAIVHALADDLDGKLVFESVPRRRVVSTPCLPERLPSSAFLQREAEDLAPSAILRQLRRSPSPPLSPEVNADVNPDVNHERSRTESISSVDSTSSRPTEIRQKNSQASIPWKEPQPYEVFRAIERKDIMYLMEIRDRAFHLLLRKSGDATPLLHAMRIGKSHRDVAIILLGAFSRWINHLEDTDLKKPKTKALLKALRTNLKLAIDYGLSKSQSDLTASFLQTLVMSEGESWVLAEIGDVSIALRTGSAGKPVTTAGNAVRKFATKELGKAELIASLEDYICNATVDLVVMAAWSIVAEALKIDTIPTHYFARDDRVFKSFSDLIHAHDKAIRTSLGKRIKWQLRVLQATVAGRNLTYRRRVDLLVRELDYDEGV